MAAQDDEGRDLATVEVADGIQVTSGLPDLAELDLLSRLVVHGSALADVALRTAVASVMTAASARGGLLGWGRADGEQLAFYGDLAAHRDVQRVFVPPRPTEVIERVGSRGLPDLPGGRARNVHFTSTYETLNPALAGRYASHTRNQRGWAQHWRHDDGPRPTLCVIHGFGAAGYSFNSAFFSLTEFYEQGWDVLLYTLPFHGPRGSGRSVLNGADILTNGFAMFSEAIIHAVHDFRVLVDHLVAGGVPRIGVTGLSLGGYTSALLGAVEPRLDFVIPNAPVTNVARLLRQWVPAGQGLALVERVHGLRWEELAGALAIHSPLTYAPVVPKDRLMIIGGLGDRLAPPEQAAWLWEHWDRPRLHWFRGNHVLHFRRAAYLREMRELMGDAA